MNDSKSMRLVYAISPERKDRHGNVVRKEGDGLWSEVGRAYVNADDSITVYLEAVPVSGKLQIREPRLRREAGKTAAGAGAGDDAAVEAGAEVAP